MPRNREQTGDVVVTAMPASATASAPAASVKIRSALWVTWAQIALEHEVMARCAREDGRSARTVDTARWSKMIDAEQRASMVAITAASHALEALFDAAVKRNHAGLAALLQTWAERKAKGKTTPTPTRILEALKHSFKLGPLANQWVGDFARLFELRREWVHFEERDHPPEPHPAGAETARETARATLETAEQAVDLLLAVLETCTRSPKPALEEWAADAGPTVAALSAQRGMRG